MLVGRSKPVARTSFWKGLALATLTVTGAESVGVAGGIASAGGERVRAVGDSARVPRAARTGAVVSSAPVATPST